MRDVAAIIATHADTIAGLLPLTDTIEQIARLMYESLRDGGTIYWCGNGGSAADAQHMSAELMGRFVTERRGLRSFALTTDSSLMTAVANDYRYDRVFVRQVETVVRNGDVLVAISTSGNSPSIVDAAAAARKQGGLVVGLTGAMGGRLKGQCDQCVCVPSNETARIQEAHGLVGHIICERLDAWIATE